MKRKYNINTEEISLCSNCGCMTHDILRSDGIYCGKCKNQKTLNKKVINKKNGTITRLTATKYVINSSKKHFPKIKYNDLKDSVNKMEKRINKLQIEMIKLLQELDNHSHIREQTIKELNSENPDIEKEIVKRYFDLQSRIDERLNYMDSPKL